MNYRMNAGFIPLDHWIHTVEGGGRNIGEACHIYDLFTYLADSEATDICTHAIVPSPNGQYRRNDNFIAAISFSDGSIGNLIYTALGNNREPKEQMEIFFDGKIVKLNDYLSCEFVGCSTDNHTEKVQNKGHRQELKEFAETIKKGQHCPIPLWQMIQATKISFYVEKLISSQAE